MCSIYLLLVLPCLISCPAGSLGLAGIGHIPGILRGATDSGHSGVAEVASVSMILLVAVAHIIVLILLIGCVLPRESSLNALVHCCALQSLLWHRIVTTEAWITGDWSLAHLMLGDVAAAHHVAASCWLLCYMLILVAVAIVEASA